MTAASGTKKARCSISPFCRPTTRRPGLCSDNNRDPNTGVPYPRHRVSPYATFDVNAGYALKTSLGTTSFTAGMRNVLDAIPPAVYSSFLTYADPSYDFVGRFLYARIEQKF